MRNPQGDSRNIFDSNVLSPQEYVSKGNYLSIVVGGHSVLYHVKQKGPR